MLHVVSDLHFGHKRISEFSNRPFKSVEEMDEALIKNWNKVVKPEDTVWSLGDFAFANIGRIMEILSQLNGDIRMVTGNHCGTIIQNKQKLLDSTLVKEITPYKEITYNGQFIVLFHYSARVWNRSHKGSWLCWGHSHGNLTPYGKSVDCGVDAKFILDGRTEYRPYSFDEIKKFMDKQKIEVVDHHGSEMSS